MANANIFAQFARPVRSVSDYIGDMDRQQGNALELAMKQMQQQQAQRGMADEDTARRIFAQYGDKARNPLMEAGLAKQAFALDDRDMAANKSRADIAKAEADARKAAQEIDSKKLADAKTRIELAGSASKFVIDNPSAENAIRAADYLLQNGVFTQEQAQKAIQEIQADPTPENAKRLATLAYQSALSAEKQLSQYFNQNRGGTFAVAGVNPVTGASADVQSAPITQSADNAASNARQAADAAAGRAVTIRGQNMTDARARESTAATLTKPFEVTGPDGNPMLVQQDKQGNIRPVQGFGPKAGAEKPLNDTQSKALLFGSRMREADKVLDALAKEGTQASIPGARAGYGIGATLNVLSSAKQQQLNQAKRDFVNAVLRRESGAVIAESEFENAEKQYFPQVGDSKEVIAQKAKNRKLATDGILQEVPANRRDALKPQEALPSADDIRKQADNILRGG